MRADPATSTGTWGINNAGVVAGYTQENVADYPTNAPGSPWVADGSGQHLLANPWTGQPAYAVAINDSGVEGARVPGATLAKAGLDGARLKGVSETAGRFTGASEVTGTAK